MSIKVLHQLGHNYMWNMISLNEDNVGDGYIISPKHVPYEKVHALVNANPFIKVFDPQIFVSSYAASNLETYSYHPCVVNTNYPTISEPQKISEIASECINLQVQLDTEIIVIPTESSPYHDQTNFDDQERKYINPFLDKMQGLQTEKKVFLQVVLDEFVIVRDTFRRKLINWLSDKPNIDGVYIILEVYSRNKQLSSVDFLLHTIEFIDLIKQTGMFVLLGYQNTETLLLSLGDPDYVTLGSYENLRMFSTSNFREKPALRQRGPNPRAYYSSLLNWIDQRYSKELERVLGANILDKSKYSPILTKAEYDWNFQRKEPYLHYFEVFTRQIKELSMHTGKDRYQKFIQYLLIAQQNYYKLWNNGVILEGDSRDLHISNWITVANSYAKNKGWI